jgi:capsule polysaccharide export protein KpsE/RkpR
MNTTKELRQVTTEDGFVLKQVPTMELLTAIWQRRWWLFKLVVIGVPLTIGISFLIPNRYTSTAQLMPPDQQSLTNMSMLNALAGGTAFSASSMSSLMNARTPGSTSIGILSSRTAQDDIINRFDLRRVYHCKLYVDARKRLAAATEFDEDKKTGLITITVTDKDKNRAREIAAAYIDELDKLVNLLSTSSARREREFLDDRLKTIKKDLDDSSHELSQFSSQNATMDIQKQGQATVEAAGKVQGELISAESELSGLRAQYSDDNVRVRQVRGRIEELQSQLRKMSGVGEDVDGATLKADQLFPSVRKLPLLGFTYYDLARKVAMQETIYETLTKQYELAKVQEAKEIPPIRVLDEPELPERKSTPHRGDIAMLACLALVCWGIVWIIACEAWKRTGDSHPAKAIGLTFMRTIRRPRLAATR